VDDFTIEHARVNPGAVGKAQRQIGDCAAPQVILKIVIHDQAWVGFQPMAVPQPTGEIRLLAGLGQGRQKDGNQNDDDPNDHQQFHQRKTVALSPAQHRRRFEWSNCPALSSWGCGRLEEHWCTGRETVWEKLSCRMEMCSHDLIRKGEGD
jgi:hypothetical protein